MTPYNTIITDSKEILIDEPFITTVTHGDIDQVDTTKQALSLTRYAGPSTNSRPGTKL